MHEIEPFYHWESIYKASEDVKSPFFARQYPDYFVHDIYGYYVHPDWDWIGSETLFVKILFADYEQRFAIIECFGEWNDTLHNDIMHFKRCVIDRLIGKGVEEFILIGENVFNFHGSDEEYYVEWFEEIEEGWIVALNFRDFIQEEWKKYGIDFYINFGGTLDIEKWRTLKPQQLYHLVKIQITRRLGM